MDFVPGKELYWLAEDFRQQHPSAGLPRNMVKNVSVNLLKTVEKLRAYMHPTATSRIRTLLLGTIYLLRCV